MLGIGNSRHFCPLCNVSKDETKSIEKIKNEGKIK